MNARKKGDIYWRKLKRYLEAQKYKEEDFGTKDSKLILAKEVFSMSAELDREKILGENGMVTGDEFKVMPPTSTGEELYKNNIIFAIKYYDHLSEILDAKDKNDLLYKNLANLAKTLKNAIRTFYKAAGINPDDGSALSVSDPEAAETEHKKASDEYERTVKNFKRSVALVMIGDINREFGIKPGTPEEYDDGFSELYEEYAKEAKENKDKIEGIRTEFNTLKKKELSLIDTLPGIKKAVRKKTRESEGNEWLTYDEAFEEYCTYLDEELRALSFAQKSCYECAKCFLSGEMADPLVANYIYNHWGEKVPGLSLDTDVYTLPGYVRVGNLASDEISYEFKNLEEMSKASQKLLDYRTAHPDKFEFQTIQALLFDNEELYKMGNMARALRNSVKDALGKSFPSALTDPQNHIFKQIYVTADAFAKTVSGVLLYAQVNEVRTIKDMFDTYADDVYFLSYSRQENISRVAIERLAERGRS